MLLLYAVSVVSNVLSELSNVVSHVVASLLLGLHADCLFSIYLLEVVHTA